MRIQGVANISTDTKLWQSKRNWEDANPGLQQGPPERAVSRAGCMGQAAAEAWGERICVCRGRGKGGGGA
jgi:hypothetical protein